MQKGACNTCRYLSVVVFVMNSIGRYTVVTSKDTTSNLANSACMFSDVTYSMLTSEDILHE